jgi:hypothetical protein
MTRQQERLCDSSKIGQGRYMRLSISVQTVFGRCRYNYISTFSYAHMQGCLTARTNKHVKFNGSYPVVFRRNIYIYKHVKLHRSFICCEIRDLVVTSTLIIQYAQQCKYLEQTG